MPEVICAHRPQRVTPRRGLQADLPAPVCDWLAGMMARPGEDRPASAAVVEKAQETALQIGPDNRADFFQRVGQSVLVGGRIEGVGAIKPARFGF